MHQSQYVLYTMLCGFKHFSWHIRVRFSDVVRLHSEIQKALPGEGLVVFSPTKSWRFHEVSYGTIPCNTSPSVRLRADWSKWSMQPHFPHSGPRQHPPSPYITTTH